MVNCKNFTKPVCLSNSQDCIWEIGKGCKNITSSTVSQFSQSSHNKDDDLILNPVSKRYVKKSGKIGQSLLLQQMSKLSISAKKSSSSSPPAARKSSPKRSVSPPAARKSSPKRSVSPPAARKSSKSSSSSSSNKLPKLQKQMDDARKNRDIKKILELNKLIQEEVTKQKTKKVSFDIPDFLKQCIDTSTNELPTLPTTMGDSDMKDVITNENNLIIINGLCYDIKELYELIKVDISQGNIWGCDPYVKRHGLILPFAKDVKDRVLSEGIKRGILPKNTRWEDKSISNADDKELRGYHSIVVKKTPAQWLQKGWAGDKTAFPTSEYYAITFEFPYRRINQNPGKIVIFPKTKEAKEFIDKKLIPVYESGALWSKKISLTTQLLVINPNIHLVFEDNQPNRWHSNKMKDLEEEISRYSPAFL